MEKKFGKLVSNVGKNAKDILEKSKNKAVQIADQNDDGKFDLEDVTAMANSVGNIVKKGARTLKETADEKARQMERKTLLPIVLEDLNDYPMPKLIRITERDKKYSESEVCKGSIGFWSDFKEMRLMNIFRDSVNVYGISFYPNYDSEFYYVNPVVHILAEGVNYNAMNHTRFVVVSPVLELRPGRNKISTVFRLPHQSGSLHEILTVFAVQGLNLLKIESRPIPGRGWEYLFFLDFTGDLAAPEMDGVLHELGQLAAEFRILGNFRGYEP